jgi:hypothetical protein
MWGPGLKYCLDVQAILEIFVQFILNRYRSIYQQRFIT